MDSSWESFKSSEKVKNCGCFFDWWCCVTWRSHQPCFSGVALCRFLRMLRQRMCARCTQKRGLSFNTSQTTHKANDHGWYTNIVIGKRASFVKNIWFLSVVLWTWLVIVILKCIIHFSIFFSVGTHSWIFVCKIIFKLHRVYSSLQKIAWPLPRVISLLWKAWIFRLQNLWIQFLAWLFQVMPT